MKVTSLFFASYRDILGAAELEFDLPEGSKVSDLTGMVRSRAGDGVLPNVLAVAVNQEYASAETELQDGDEVAFIPPVAGG